MPFHAPFGGHVKSSRLAQWPDGCREARETECDVVRLRPHPAEFGLYFDA